MKLTELMKLIKTETTEGLDQDQVVKALKTFPLTPASAEIRLRNSKVPNARRCSYIDYIHECVKNDVIAYHALNLTYDRKEGNFVIDRTIDSYMDVLKTVPGGRIVQASQSISGGQPTEIYATWQTEDGNTYGFDRMLNNLLREAEDFQISEGKLRTLDHKLQGLTCEVEFSDSGLVCNVYQGKFGLGYHGNEDMKRVKDWKRNPMALRRSA
jgi:hypothetical protein